MAIINFKGNEDLKEAIRLAAFYTGKKNSSDFIRSLVEKNSDVQKELKKLLKKVVK